MVKPFDFGVLFARLRALIRRGPHGARARVHHREPGARPRRSYGAWAGETVELTSREFTLLEFLGRRANTEVSRAELIDRVWEGADVSPNVVNVYVAYLRRLLERSPGARLIHTVRVSATGCRPADMPIRARLTL